MDPQRERMLDDWLAIRNAMLRAEAGELLVKYMRESDFIAIEGEGGESAAVAQQVKADKNDKIIGIYVDIILKFPEALDREFTEDEVNNIQSALSAIESAQPESPTE